MAAGLGPGQRWRTTQVGQPEEAHRHVVEAGVAAAEIKLDNGSYKAVVEVSAPVTVIGKSSQTSTCKVAMRGAIGGSADPSSPPLATAFHQRLSGMQEEVAEAYNIMVITFRGLNAITNFDMSRYDVKSILDSPVIPVGNGAK
uniref:Uncharacterized protein n=1 Tax=Oryza sativa subsp. japonica TaxID=39947 RepID=Q10HW4_ORYSJ|nr:hypothetical protein LOC_Os03g37710 [Oryza sativa Japonica Group]